MRKSERSKSFLIAISQLASRGNVVAVCGHKSPDGDALGAQVALTRVLVSLGCKAFAITPNKLPPYAKHFLKETPHCSEAKVKLDWQVVALDCSNRKRLLESITQEVFINVDHHIDNTAFAEHNFVEPSSAATCELLTELFLECDIEFDKLAANALLMGIMSDTGNFCYQNTSAQSLDAAKHLLNLGASPSEVSEKLYCSYNIGRAKLLSIFLERAKLEFCDQVAVSQLGQKDYALTNSSRTDTEQFINELLSIESVKVAVFLDDSLGYVKGSLRSKNKNIAVNKLASHWGGGGHVCAAGFEHRGNLEDFYPKLLEQLSKIFS